MINLFNDKIKVEEPTFKLIFDSDSDSDSD